MSPVEEGHEEVASGAPLDIVQSRLEELLSRRNLPSDEWLQQHMSADVCIALATLSQHPGLVDIGADFGMLLAAARRSEKLGVDEANYIVWPVVKSRRDTLILRDLPTGITEAELRDLFGNSEEIAGSITSMKLELNRTAYVSFETDDAAQAAGLWLRSQRLRGEEVRCAMRADHSSRSFYTSMQSPQMMYATDSWSQQGWQQEWDQDSAAAPGGDGGCWGPPGAGHHGGSLPSASRADARDIQLPPSSYTKENEDGMSDEEPAPGGYTHAFRKYSRQELIDVCNRVEAIEKPESFVAFEKAHADGAALFRGSACRDWAPPPAPPSFHRMSDEDGGGRYPRKGTGTSWTRSSRTVSGSSEAADDAAGGDWGDSWGGAAGSGGRGGARRRGRSASGRHGSGSWDWPPDDAPEDWPGAPSDRDRRGQARTRASSRGKAWVEKRRPTDEDGGAESEADLDKPPAAARRAASSGAARWVPKNSREAADGEDSCEAAEAGRKGGADGEPRPTDAQEANAGALAEPSAKLADSSARAPSWAERVQRGRATSSGDRSAAEVSEKTHIASSTQASAEQRSPAVASGDAADRTAKHGVDSEKAEIGSVRETKPHASPESKPRPAKDEASDRGDVPNSAASAVKTVASSSEEASLTTAASKTESKPQSWADRVRLAASGKPSSNGARPATAKRSDGTVAASPNKTLLSKDASKISETQDNPQQVASTTGSAGAKAEHGSTFGGQADLRPTECARPLETSKVVECRQETAKPSKEPIQSVAAAGSAKCHREVATADTNPEPVDRLKQPQHHVAVSSEDCRVQGKPVDSVSCPRTGDQTHGVSENASTQRSADQITHANVEPEKSAQAAPPAKDVVEKKPQSWADRVRQGKSQASVARPKAASAGVR
eukprot:TRINITY_DN46078_c0_g1_i1.p1 TRINITY_DN46078_c0_g1~~TRINITY_DN46078_c0_g1_i1.p1  ORF type:complete len:895 (+),score=161.10 TRINITY_DN46078_c0_g1_i1:64-2748(+)